MKPLYFIFILSLFAFSGCSKEEINEITTIPVLPPVAALKTGVFWVSPVEGLNFRTETQQGITNSKGEFQYKEGEKISFFVGAVKIGESIGKEILSPIDIALTPNANINTLEVKNIAAFLQTLDADKNPNNGIKISMQAVAALPAVEVDFKNHLIQWLGEMVGEINQKVPMNLKVVFPEIAASNLAKTLNLDYQISGLEAGPFFDIIERWETRTRNVNWIHKFDSQGRISESTAYEKFPWRPILKHVYKNYNSHGYPQFYEGHYLHQDGSSGWFLNFYLVYGQNSEVKSFSWSPDFLPDPNYYVYEIITVDEQRRVTQHTTIAEGTLVSTTSLGYNDQDGSLKVTYYDNRVNRTQSMNEYYFKEFGSISVLKGISGSGRLTRLTNSFYRENYTLERVETIDYKTTGEVMRTIQFLNENGGTYRVEKYSDDFLFELYERSEDRTSTTTVYKKEDGSYYIEYRDSNNRKYKTDYYDSEGNLINTVG